MEDKIVLDIISGLKGRLGYEEKKAKKLGFSSIYEYMEDKITSENNILNTVTEVNTKPKILIKKKIKAEPKTCGCC